MRTPSYRYSAQVIISMYVIFEHRPRIEHTILHLKHHPVPIRENLVPVARLLLRVPTRFSSIVTARWLSLIRTLNKMMASSTLSRNARLDRAGTARGSGPVGFGSARQPRRRLSGGRLSTHRGTRQGMSTSHKKGAVQGVGSRL